MRRNVYVNGKLIARDDPCILPGIRVIMKTYELANDPKFKELILARSHLTGEQINRFNHVCQDSDDLLKKQKLIRLACHLTGGCIQRCMGCDAINALSVVTYDVDQKYGTEYHKNFLRFLRYFQDRDLVAAAAQTDVKGDRSLRPHQQPDPDMYVHVVKKTDDGIVVRGAKNHITIAAHADELICLPTRAMRKEDSDYAVAFAIPADAEGVKLITHSGAPRPREIFKAPISEHGPVDSFVIFDDVFVPWERVFLCGEYDFSGPLALTFAIYHRHSYTGCKPAVSDIILGFGALVAEYQGIWGEDHVRSKLVDIASVGELVYASGIASAIEGKKSGSGTYMPNPVYVNVGRRHAGLNIYHEYEILADLAGGLPATLPYEADFTSEETRKYLEKYILRKQGIPAENIHRCFRAISDILCSAWGGVMAVAGVHGGGSPIMEEIGIAAALDFERRKSIAKYLAGIQSDG